MKRVHLLICGYVQGVFFRVNTRAKATELSLTGWVKNLPDGSVECMAEGGESELHALIAWCRTHPGQAQVTEVQVEWLNATGEYFDFQIRY